jgi:HD-like signal output (HDOD) protein
MMLMPALKQRLEKAISVGHLPTLQGILTDLEEFTSSPHATIEQISEHISRDPSLSVRLLRISNSAYYARAEPVVDIEDAVLFLGVAQIRIVAMTTRCVEAMCPKDQSGFEWTDFWRHCIATANFSRMLGRCFVYPRYNAELSYMVGLLHDVGKLVIAMLSPEGFKKVINGANAEQLSFHDAEQRYLDTDHGALGGWYLERQNLPEQVFEAVRCHHKWELAVDKQELSAMVNVADYLARAKGFGCSGNMEPVRGFFYETPAWIFLQSRLQMRIDLDTVQHDIAEEAGRLVDLVEHMLPARKKAAAPTITPAAVTNPVAVAAEPHVPAR